MKWIVQAFDKNVAGQKYWRDVVNHESDTNGEWEAEDAGLAFFQAVLGNRWEKTHATSYRVVPHDGGVTFNVQLNVNAVEHV